MRRESDPRIKRAEDKHTEFEAERMSAQEAINARRAAEASRRGGANETDTPPETGASSSSGAIGHIHNEGRKEPTCRAALAPISRAALAPIKEKGSTVSAPVSVVTSTTGSTGSAPAPVVAPTTKQVRQGDKDIEDHKIRQGDDVTEDRRQGNIGMKIKHYKKSKDVHDIDKHIAEIVRNNNELENTINNMNIKDGTDCDNDIIYMFNDMMGEGIDRFEKLAETHQAASAPKSRAASAPISRAALAPTSRAAPAPTKIPVSVGAEAARDLPGL